MPTLIPLDFLVFILFVHWFGDFVLQSNKMAIDKSSSILALLAHSSVYLAVLMAGAFIGCAFWKGHNFHFTGMFIILWVVLNAVAHCVQDFFTSKLNAWLYLKGQATGRTDSHWHHLFFVSVGFDQFLHYATMVAVAVVLFNYYV